MARKILDYVVSDEGRDKGKMFRITELSAEASEEWGGRAIFALMNAGIEMPDDYASLGLSGLASLGIEAIQKVPFEAAKPLFDTMMTCVKCIPDPSKPNVERPLFADDIEEVATRIKLRREVIMLHIGFFTAASK